MNQESNKPGRTQFNQDQPPQRRRPSFTIWVWLLALAFLYIGPYLLFNSQKGKEITWKQLKTNILDINAAEKIVIVNDEKAEIYIKKEFANDPRFKDAFKTVPANNVNNEPQYWLMTGPVESFERRLEEAQKSIPDSQRPDLLYRKQRNVLPDILTWVLPLVVLFLLWNYFLRRMMSGGSGGSSLFSFGKSKAMLVEKEKSNITFADVAGLEEAEQEVKEIVDFLKSPETFTKLGAKIPKGVILVGPPGTGKTLLAKAMAGEAEVPFFSISGSEFVEMFVGVGASRVRDLFRQAKEKSPCIVFIDEIDAIGRSRGKGAFLSGANDERESTLNQLLTEMDGFGTNTGVIVLAATNRADMLDPALLRPGRFDRHIYLELPNLKEREAIFKVHLRPLILEENIDTAFLAGQTPGFSGADIANICNEAALIAARKKESKVNMKDRSEAIDRIVAGAEKKSKIISAEEKRVIAYHEAGHALVSWLMKNVDPVVKVSIIPRGKSLGSAWYLPEEKQLRTQQAFFEHLCVTLGGRAAEETIFGEISSGALDDLEKVTKEAYMMVSYYGFNKKLGNVSFYDSTGQRDMSIQKPYSEDTAKMIDEEVRKTIAEAYEKTVDLLNKNKDSLTKIAELLLKKELIFKEDIETILGKRSQNQLPLPDKPLQEQL